MITARLSYIDGSPAAGVPLRAEIISGDGSLVVDGVATSAGGLFPFYFTAVYTPGTATI
ncbi:hypothetical protein IIA79_07255, partial [bacterium]|nr:hypothetical protein [bacterium]